MKMAKKKKIIKGKLVREIVGGEYYPILKIENAKFKKK